MATHSSILAWRIPWMEEPGWLQSMGSQRVRHDWGNSLSLSYFNTIIILSGSDLCKSFPAHGLSRSILPALPQSEPPSVVPHLIILFTSSRRIFLNLALDCCFFAHMLLKPATAGRIIVKDIKQLLFILFIYLLLPALSLHCCAQAFSSCRARASHWGGFSCCRVWALGL